MGARSGDKQQECQGRLEIKANGLPGHFQRVRNRARCLRAAQ